MHRLDGIIAIGGEGTMASCAAMPDVPVIGVPKTIDNDIVGTDHSIGFQTAVQIATDSIDRLYSTAESHKRRHGLRGDGARAGWIGLEAGIAGAADVILLPEHPFDIELVARRVKQRHARGPARSRSWWCPRAPCRCPARWTCPTYPLDANGWPRLGGHRAAGRPELEVRGTDVETRVTVLGHVQRGGSPVAFDRVLATRLGHRRRRGGGARAMGQDGGHDGPDDRDDTGRRGRRRTSHGARPISGTCRRSCAI